MKKIDGSYEFRILDEVSKDGDLTQRSLSQRLGVALGLTNLYIRRLVKRGFIKVVNIKPNRLRYELTPSGIAKKTSLAFQYIQDSYVFYREARKTLTQKFEEVKNSGGQSIVLYGAGEIVEIALLSLQEVKINLAAIVSSQQKGEYLCGRPIYPPEAILSMAYDRVVVFELEREEAKKALDVLEIDPSKVVWVGV
jgi:DNA-binding MarR family transcriptional regulator